MIQMPQRSVTRFFIPLIDVLLLLFSIFLLMPAFSGEASGDPENRPKLTTEELTDSLESLKRELQRKTLELQKLEKLRDPARAIDKMRAELERLRKEKQQALDRPNYVRVIDIDGKTGNLSFYDAASLDNPYVPVPNEKTARELITRHQKEAGKRYLYYQFLFPRQETGYPTQAQELEYRRWFAGVANSLKEKLP